MQRNVTILTHIRQFFFVVSLFLIFSCSQDHRDNPVRILKPPVTIKGKEPIITLLDTCPPLRTIVIPTKSEESFVLKTNNSKILIVPPDVKPAGFTVLMHHTMSNKALALGQFKADVLTDTEIFGRY